jgi:phage gp36-like protein
VAAQSPPYVLPSELTLYGANPNALQRVSLDEQTAACQAATDVLDGYFSSRYPLPFLAVNDTSIKVRAAHIATWFLLSQQGRNPAAQWDDQIDRRYEEAIAWAVAVQKQATNLNVTVLQPTAPNYSFPAVISGRSRGWTRRC